MKLNWGFEMQYMKERAFNISGLTGFILNIYFCFSAMGCQTASGGGAAKMMSSTEGWKKQSYRWNLFLLFPAAPDVVNPLFKSSFSFCSCSDRVESPQDTKHSSTSMTQPGERETRRGSQLRNRYRAQVRINCNLDKPSSETVSWCRNTNLAFVDLDFFFLALSCCWI